MANINIFILIGFCITVIVLIILIVNILLNRKERKIKHQLNMAIDIGKIDIRDNKGKFIPVDNLFKLLKRIKKETS